MHNRIFLLFVSAGTIPLANAGTAGIGKYTCSNLVEDVNEAIPLNGKANLL